MPEGNLIFIEELAILMLLIATLVAIIFQRLRVPYTVGLVLVGASLALLRPEEAIEVTPDLIMALLVPPLLFEAAFHLDFDDLRPYLGTIAVLAIPGVIVTTFLVGGVVAWGTSLSLPLAIVFGSLIAATDPVAVIALFRSLGVPKRLQLLIEGESLFNDGTAVVVFGLALAVVETGEFNLFTSLFDFVLVAGGGLVLGVVLGLLISFIIGRVKDPLIETALTFILAYGAFLAAEELHVSGVLAVVGAGILSGNLGPQGMSPTTRIVVFNFWEFAAFLANSFVFLLIGLQVEIPLLVENWTAIVVGILAVLIARAIVIYSSTVGRDLPMSWKHVTFWGGLRGAISLALVLSLPLSLGSARSEMQAMAFGVVLFTLLVQGLTMQPLVRRLNIAPKHEQRERFNLFKAQSTSLRNAYLHLRDVHEEGLISESTWRRTSKLLQEFINEVTLTVRELLISDPELAGEDMDRAWREVLKAQRSSLIQLYTNGAVSEDAFAELLGRIDTALDDDEITWSEIEELQSRLSLG
jgi:CPA1 family monovalent cation:H+ antiporter